VVGLLFTACALCMVLNKLSKHTTLRMADELAQRRLQAGVLQPAA
jgi:glycoside/pentoside/hexuronide:cation symporter, GPH family